MKRHWIVISLGGLLLVQGVTPALGRAMDSQLIHSSVLRTQPSARYHSLARLRHLALSLVNRDRTQQGSPNLVNNPLLNQVAQAHAEDMLRQNYLSHYSKDGSTPEERVRAAGGHMITGENILSYPLVGQRRQSELIAEFQSLFVKSPQHRQIMMRSRYSQFGYGFAASPNGRIVAVQLFGIPDAP